MTSTPRQGIYAKWTLSEADLAEIEQLGRICQEHEPIELRIGWEGLRLRTGDLPHEHVYYRDDVLIGLITLDGLGSEEAEATGMVHPGYRRQGVFRSLVEAAREACRKSNTESLILYFDHRSAAATAFAEAIGAQHDFSEHSMRREQGQPAPQLTQRLDFRKADAGDAAAIAAILATDFDADPSQLQQNIARNMQSPVYQYYIAALDGQPIGSLNVQNLGGDAYVYGFVVRPEQRGRGYGKEILARAIADITAARPQPVFIEVETNNDPAYGLYRALGFEVTTTYDYYRVAL